MVCRFEGLEVVASFFGDQVPLPWSFCASSPQARLLDEGRGAGFYRHLVKTTCRYHEKTGSLLRTVGVEHLGDGVVFTLWWLTRDADIHFRLFLRPPQLAALTRQPLEQWGTSSARVAELAVGLFFTTNDDTLLDVSLLAPFTHLRELSVSSVRVLNLAAAAPFPQLSDVSLDCCRWVESLDWFRDHPRVRSLSVQLTGVKSPLLADDTPVLSKMSRHVRVALSNWLPRSRVVAGHKPKGQEGAEACGVPTDFAQYRGRSSLAVLRTCGVLEELNVSSCPGIRSLSVLAGHPTLRHLRARHTPVVELTGLHCCPNLCELDLQWCTSLVSLAALAGCQSLKTLLARGSAVSDLSGLPRCPLLEKLDLSRCTLLSSLTALAGSPSLRQLSVESSAVVNLGGLDSCLALEEVDVSKCRRVTSLEPLSRCVVLRTVAAADSGVTNITGLQWCPELRLLDLTGTPLAQEEVYFPGSTQLLW